MTPDAALMLTPKPLASTGRNGSQTRNEAALAKAAPARINTARLRSFSVVDGIKEEIRRTQQKSKGKYISAGYCFFLPINQGRKRLVITGMTTQVMRVIMSAVKAVACNKNGH